MVTKVVDDIIKYGSYQRGYLGVEIADLDDAIIKEKNLDIDVKQGVVVMKLSNGGAAQFADVRPRDVITQIDGKTVKSSNDLMEIVASSKVGQTLRLNVIRDGRAMEIPVTLKKGAAK
jgi:S1-C subfamily serine protease